MFTDSIEHNLETIKELLQNAPEQHKAQARVAFRKMEKAVMGIIKDAAGSPATGLGLAFAVFLVAQRMVQSPQQGDSERRLIQLLS